MTEESKSGGDRFGTGCLIAFILMIGLVFVAPLLSPKQKPVDVRLMGRVDSHFFAAPSFELAVWHQHPGNLRNGKLSVRVKGKSIANGEEYKVHSFETWPPNQANAVNYSFPLHNYDPNQPLYVTCYVTAANARDTSTRFVWQNNRWKE